MAKPAQTPKKGTNTKAIAALTLSVLLLISIAFTVLGFTGMKLDGQGLYKLLAWIPTPSADSDWREALVPGADLGETMQQTYTAAALTEGDEVTPTQLQETVKLLSRRLSAGGWTSAVVSVVEGKVQMNLPQDGTHDHAYEMLAGRGEVSFAGPDGTAFLTNEHIVSGSYHLNPNDQSYALSFTLDAEGKRIFAEKTTELIGQSMSLVVDGATVASPGINQPLTEGAASLPGFDVERGKAYAAMMQTGPLPVTLSLEGSSAGAPILGASVQNTLIIALAVAVLIVIVYFVLRFRLSGLVAAWLLVVQVVGGYFLAALIRAGFTLSTLIALYTCFGLLVYSLLSVLLGMQEDMLRGRGARQSLRDALKNQGKLGLDVLLAMLLLSVVLIIVDHQLIGQFARMLALGLLLDLLLYGIGLRLLLGSAITVFGNKDQLYVGRSAQKEAA